MFEGPEFTVWKLVYTAIGAAVFWGKWGRTRLRVYILWDVVRLLPVKGRSRATVEFLVFVTLGCIVGIGIVQPTSPMQALSAGLAWTGIFSHREYARDLELR